MFRNVLVPLDGSPAAERAVAYGAVLPVRVLTLQTVIPKIDAPSYDWFTDVSVDEHHAQQRAHAERYLAGIAKRYAAPDREIVTRVDEGDPAECVLAAATSANLVVVTSHGHGAASPLTVGRTANRIIRYADVPVLVIRPNAAPPEALKRIVVPLDGSELAEGAAPLATELAAQTGAPICLTSVIDPAFVPIKGMASAERQVRAYLESERERLLPHRVEIRTEIHTGVPANELIATTNADDLVVLTAFGSGTGQRWLIGGVADKLLRSAAAPVLLIRPSTGVRAAA
jgi:nucleotide-binding universal stress UspA family protein